MIDLEKITHGFYWEDETRSTRFKPLFSSKFLELLKESKL